MKLYLIRHGETDWNKARKIQGQVDIPLNEFGIHLARETRDGLAAVHFDRCFSSPLERARQTAEIILERQAPVPLVNDERIEEMAFGAYEGKRIERQYAEVPAEFDYFFDAPERFRPAPGGEDFAALKRRTGDFLTELYQHREYAAENILITTHGAALAALLNNIRGADLKHFWGSGVHRNCAVTTVAVEDGRPVILAENIVYYKDKIAPWKR